MKTIKQFALVIGFGALINNVWADNGTFSAPAGSPWSLSGSLGMMQYNNVYGQDGETATGRFGLEYQLLHHDYFNLGLELGLQNGNFMRLAIPEETIKLIGGMPVEVQAKPMVDLLLTSEFFSDLTPLYVLLKGGIAYRRLKQTFGDSLNDLAKFSPEVQAGIGYPISKNTSITLSYQHIFGDNPNFIPNLLTGKDTITNIPSQQAALIGFSFVF